MLYISPSILSADFSKLGEEIRDVENAGCTRLHIDVMDGVFVPNISFGLPVIKSIRPHTAMFFDVHLMITDPRSYVEKFVGAGADSITIHIETCDDPQEVLNSIGTHGAKRGIALKPSTPVSAVAGLLSNLDFVLVMSVEPGFGGQSFIPESLEKIEELYSMIKSSGKLIDIGVDGGISGKNIEAVANAGANVIIAGEAVFGAKNRKEAVENMLYASGRF